MKIAVWLYRLGGGGAERVVSELASSFSDQGHDVRVLVHTHDNPYAGALGGGRLVVLENWLSRVLRPRTLFCLFGLVKYLKREKPDVVFTTGVSHGVLLALVAKLFRVRSRIIIRETNTMGAQAGKNSSFLYNVFFFLARVFYPMATGIIVPSKGVQDDLEARIPKLKGKTVLIYNPVDARGIQDKARAALDHPELEDKPFILAVGRLVPQKGYDVLIEAWAPLANDGGADLVILGEGGERSRLTDLAERYGVSAKLHLLGFNDNPFRYMARAKVFVLSSYFEGLPNALLQAIACGAPVVATDCPSGPSEILRGGALAPLVPVGDVEALRGAIEAVLEAGAQGNVWDEIGDLYDPDAVSRQYLDVFEASVGVKA